MGNVEHLQWNKPFTVTHRPTAIVVIEKFDAILFIIGNIFYGAFPYLKQKKNWGSSATITHIEINKNK